MRKLTFFCYTMVRWRLAESRFANSALCYSKRDVERARLESSVITAGMMVLMIKTLDLLEPLRK